jgi:hypothetical protein
MKKIEEQEWTSISIPALREYFEQMRMFDEEQLDEARRTTAWLPVVSGGPDTPNGKKRAKARR